MMGLDISQQNGKFTNKLTRLFIAGWCANEAVTQMAARHGTDEQDAAAKLTELKTEIQKLIK
jgi:hypothetical protein